VARGEYFMWAAHDDRWDSECILSWVEVLNQDEGCGLVFSDYIILNLETGEKTKCFLSSSNSPSKLANYLNRILEMSPSLIYGMFRKSELRKTEVKNFDFFDVHLTTVFALQSRIRVVNKFLYTAGVKGVRIPFSLTHKKIYRIPFLREQFSLIKRHFGFPRNITLFIFACLIMLKNKWVLKGY
jgi:hypothetical protein